VVWAGSNAAQRTNSACCMALYSMLYLGKTPEEAWQPFRAMRPAFLPFHDATPCVCHYKLTIPHVLSAVAKARECGFFDFDTFDVEEYEQFEQVENGDLSWIVQGRFCAFAGPHESRAATPEGYVTLCPEDYVPHFKRWGVSAVVRLNKPYYSARRFVSAGIGHRHMYYLDGSNAPPDILEGFIRYCEETDGAIAVHCKAGLGRTGTCIGAYVMKHYRFTAAEIIAWLRVCRPGSVIGPQQQYLESLQEGMWAEGDRYRARIGMPPHGTGTLRLPKELRGELKAADDARGEAAAAGRSRGEGGSASASSARSEEAAVVEGMARVAVAGLPAAGSVARRAADAAAAAASSKSSPSRGGIAASAGASGGYGSPPRAATSRAHLPSRFRAAGDPTTPGTEAAGTPSSVRSDASQGDHLRASRAARSRGTPGTRFG